MVETQLRSLAAAHRHRFRRVLARGYETLALVEAEGEAEPAADALALAAACELARLAGGLVVDSARNIGTPVEMAARHHLVETAIVWLHARGEYPAQIDDEGVVTVQCRVVQTTFGGATGGEGRPMAGLTPRWTLHAEPAAPDEDAAAPGDAVEPAPPRPAPAVARGRMAPLPTRGAYQASLDLRRLAPGRRYLLWVQPADTTIGLRNAMLPVNSTTTLAPSAPIGYGVGADDDTGGQM
jgi:hypothetical protein